MFFLPSARRGKDAAGDIIVALQYPFQLHMAGNRYKTICSFTDKKGGKINMVFPIKNFKSEDLPFSEVIGAPCQQLVLLAKKKVTIKVGGLQHM